MRSRERARARFGAVRWRGTFPPPAACGLMGYSPWRENPISPERSRQAEAGCEDKMSVTLRVTAGPHLGEEFSFDRHDTFVVGRKQAHFSVPDDSFLSRNHFLVEIDPPRCLIKDLGSRNGTKVNGKYVKEYLLQDGDIITAGHSSFAVQIGETWGELPAVSCERCQEVAAPREVLVAMRPGEGNPRWVCKACQIKAQRFPQPPPGFWIERRIGGGGMGEVFLGHRIPNRQAVAIKMMIPTVATGERARLYFRRELEVLRNLRHQNIVEFYEMFELDGQYQLVMEYVDGMDAKDWVTTFKTGKLSVRLAATLGYQLLDALDHAHGRGYVHRDIKPSNILITGDPVDIPKVKLSDFGLAKSFRDNAGFTKLTHQGDIAGSVGFISPDHIRDFREVKEPADIYSAGATIYYLMTLAYPYLGFNPQSADAYKMILEHPCVPLRAHRPDVPEAFDRIIRKALEKKPKNRWKSAREMAEALKPFEDAEPSALTVDQPSSERS